MTDFEYDVFLSHTGGEKPAVEFLAERLRQDGLNPFLDRWHLVPGVPWQDELERALADSATVAIFFGKKKQGPWLREEMRVALDRAAREQDEFRAIPVLLPGADPTVLPAFLSQRTWVDFRPGLDDEDAFVRLLAGIKGEPSPIEGYELPDEPTPYRGLESFDAESAASFFGRDDDIRHLATRLERDRFVAVVGASGCGKSSLVRAGLRSDEARDVVPGIERWRTAVVRPGAHPLRSLATGLAAELPATGRLRVADELSARLEARDDGLWTGIAGLWPDTSTPLLLVIDQFEELFTHARTEKAEHETTRFVANLTEAVAQADERLHLVITLRADFLSHALAYPALPSLLDKHSLHLGELGPEGLREAIVFPLRRLGGYFEKGVVRAILHDVEQQRGALPSLQHALLELWRERKGPWLTLEAYERTGGVIGALQRRADRTIDALTAEERAIAKSILIRLTTLGEGTSDTRRRAARDELYGARFERTAVDRVLSALSQRDARLVSVTDDAIEVTHEALLQSWPTLRHWLEEDRDALRLHRRFTEAAKEWEHMGCEDDLLYRGGRLQDAEAWASSEDADPNDLELRFLRASTDLRERQVHREQAIRRRLKWRATIAIGVAIVAALAGALALDQMEKAEAAERVAKDNLIDSYFLLGSTAIEQERFAAGFAWYWKAYDEVPTGDPRAVGARNLISSWSSKVGRALRHEDSVVQVAFSPDGSTVLTGSLDGTARLWDATSGAPRGEPLRHEGGVTAVAFSPDGTAVLTASVDDTARLWDATSGMPRCEALRHKGDVVAVAFSPDGGTVLTGSRDWTAQLWDATSGAPRGEPLRHDGGVTAVAFSPDGTIVLTGSIVLADSLGGRAQLWDVTTSAPRGEPLRFESQFWVEGGVALSPDGATVLTGSWGGPVRLWDAKSGAPRGEPLRHEGLLQAVAFSPNGRTVLTGSSVITEDLNSGGIAQLWNAKWGTSLGEPLHHDGQVTAVAFSPDSETVLTGSADGTARLWDAKTGAPRGEPLRHGGSDLAVAFSPDGVTVLTGSDDGTARVWDTQSGMPRGKPLRGEGFVGPASVVVFSPDGATVLTGGGDGMARLWDAMSGAPRRRPLRHNGDVLAVAFSPDGATVLTGGGDWAAHLWDVERGIQRCDSLRHEEDVLTVAFSPDGATVLTGSDDRTARLWDAKSGTPRGQPLRHEGSVLAVAFSPDGAAVLTGSSDKTARLWDAKGGGPRGEPLSHGSSVLAVAFSPDSATALTGSDDGTARLWDSKSGAPRREPLRHDGPVLAVAFSPDGTTILTGSDDGTARLWDAKSGVQCCDWLRHEGSVLAVAFSPDGETVLTGSDDLTAQLWDANSGAPRGAPMRHGDRVSVVVFSPDGATALTSSGDGTVRLWDIDPPALDDPERLQLSVETDTGYRFDDQGTLWKLTYDEWRERRDRLDELGGWAYGPSADRTER